MKASEYKKYKGLRKESLRDNMTDIEVALTNIGEIAARDIASIEKPSGLKETKVSQRWTLFKDKFTHLNILSLLFYFCI